MLKIFIMTLIIVIIFSVPVMAEETGMHGLISGQIGLDGLSDQNLLKLDFYYTCNDWLDIGLSDTYLNNDSYLFIINLFTGGFEPIPYCLESQLYEIYVRTNLNDNINAKISYWYNSPIIYNGAGVFDFRESKHGLYLKAEFKF